MKRYSVYRFLGFFIAFSMIFCSLARADFYMKQKRHTDAFEVMGKKQPAKDEFTVIWMGGDKARIDQATNNSMIIRQDKKLMCLLDNTKKTYIEMPFGSLDDIINGALSRQGASKEQMEQAQKAMKSMAGMMKAEAQVTDTGETKKIKDWNCRKYILKMKMMMVTSTSEVWATEDIKVDLSLYQVLSSAFAANQPGFKEAFEEMKKIKGIPVLTISSGAVMGANVTTTEELIEAGDQSAPAGVYDIPAGYSKAK